MYIYITKYDCAFLKLGESIYVAIPILLGSQHSLVILIIPMRARLVDLVRAQPPHVGPAGRPRPPGRPDVIDPLARIV